MKYELIEVQPNIFLFKAKNQFVMNRTFMRLQEFYESPFRFIRGKKFDHMDFIDEYGHNNGEFDCFTNIYGTNVPDKTIRAFYDLYGDDIDKHEKTLYDVLCKADAFNRDKFYLIGCFEEESIENKNVLDHELAHAYYYMHPEYKKTVNRLVRSIPTKEFNHYRDVMKQSGYWSGVYLDEIQAYLATNSMVETKDLFDVVDWNIVYELQRVFDEERFMNEFD
jgi:hypothetical protein